MTISSYQIGRLLARLRQWHGLPRRSPAPAERVAVSPDAAEWAREQAPDGSSFPELLRAASGEPIPAQVVEQKAYPPPIREELERRAGTFMNPPVLPPAPLAHIPRVKPRGPRQIR